MSDSIYDIFCSYDSLSAGKFVIETYEKLVSKNWDVMVDRYQKLYMGDSKKDISRSKIFLCFFTTKYSGRSSCRQKLEYAKKVNKRVIFLLLEDVNIAKLHKTIKAIVENAPKITVYDRPNDLLAWFGDLFEQIRIEMNIIDQMNAKNKIKFFRSTVERPLVYDLFVSFDDENKDLVNIVCGEMIRKGFKIWADIMHTYVSLENDSLHTEIEDAILESRMIICFVTERYCASKRCQSELKFSFTNKRKCIMIMLENYDVGAAGTIFGQNIFGTIKCNAYEEPNCLENWSDSFYEKLYTIVRKVYCQLYVKEDFKDFDENNELDNMYRKLRRIVLDCGVLREKTAKLRAECYKRTSLNERLETSIETVLKSFETQNKALQGHKKLVDITCKRFEEKQKLIIEKFRVYKQEVKRFTSSKSTSHAEEKKRLKLVSQELINLFERIKFSIREQLLLLDELYCNAIEYYKIFQIKNLDFVNNGLELRRIYNESNLLFKTFKTNLDKQSELSDDLKNITTDKTENIFF